MDFSVAFRYEKGLDFESSDGGVMKVVKKRPHYVGVASLSIF